MLWVSVCSALCLCLSIGVVCLWILGLKVVVRKRCGQLFVGLVVRCMCCRSVVIVFMFLLVCILFVRFLN
jgi:hypothetical protein